ncbi:MAG: PIN domain-containing protein [Methylococcales bacterium]
MTQVFDLTDYKPIPNENYFVDTNVWYWTTYLSSKEMSSHNKTQDYQMEDYPSFIEKALNDGASLCHCAMTFTELANIIEHTEYELYKLKSGKEYFSKKEFRKDIDARTQVLKEIDTAWSTINSMSKCIDVNLNSDFVDKSKIIMDEGNVDPFDAFYVQIMRDNKIDFIVTDDHDFCSTNQIIVTSNKKALR